MTSADRQTKVVPAPLLVLACLVLGFAAHRFHPLPFLPDLGIAWPVVGIAVCLAALVVGLSGVREFRRHNTPTNPFRPTTTLVTSGVFRHTRNPMYLGLVTLLLGVAIALNSAALLVAAVVLAALVHLVVIRPEERFLAARYGRAFEAYCRATRRWL